MKNEFVQISNEQLQYLTDLSRFIIEKSEVLTKQGESIKENLKKIVLYIVTKKYSVPSTEANEEDIKIQRDFLEIPPPVRDEYYSRIQYVLKEKMDLSTPPIEGLNATMKYVFEKTKNTLWNYFIFSICIFIVQNNFLSKIPIGSLNKIPFIPNMRMSTEQLYETLKKMYESKAIGFIKLIPCSNAVLDSLITTFQMNHNKKFIKVIQDNNCKLTSIQKICYIYSAFEHLLFLYQQKIELSPQIVPMEESPQEEKGAHPFLDEIQKIEEEVLNPLLDVMFEMTLETIDPEKKRYKAYNLYSILRPHLSNEEVELLGVEGHYSQYIPKENTTVTSPQRNKNESISFQLPQNYFEQKMDSNQDIYLSKLKEHIRKRGKNIFEEFINYLAEENYIDNKIEVKMTFAFRLTGICRPEKLIDKIEWKRDASYLFYIIKYFHNKNNYKSTKTATFFSCEDSAFKNIKSFSSYAKREGETKSDPFLTKIKELYPDIEK